MCEYKVWWGKGSELKPCLYHDRHFLPDATKGCRMATAELTSVVECRDSGDISQEEDMTGANLILTAKEFSTFVW